MIMKKTQPHIQTPAAGICHCRFERMKILSELRASLYEAICKVDEEIESIRRSAHRHAQRFHRDNRRKKIQTRNRRGEYPDSTAGGNTGHILPVLSEYDYCRIGQTEL